MLVATLAFACGIVLAHFAWRPPSWWFVASLVYSAAAVAFLGRRPHFALLLTITAFVFGGAFAAEIQGESGKVAVWLGDGENVTVTAHVISEGNLQADGAGSTRQQVDIETESIASEVDARTSRSSLRLTTYSKTTSADGDESISSSRSPSMPMHLLRYGQRLRFNTTLNLPHNFRNPGAFDYAGYLREQGIQATASAKFSELDVLPGFEGSKFGFWRSRIHRSIVSRIHRLWPEPTAGLIDAMAIGERTFIERNERVNFQRSGTYHVLVVAGLHIGILAGFALWSLRLFGLRDVIASLFAMALIFAYAVLTGEGAPVWRAAIMFAVYLVTRLLYRARAMLNALAIAALCLLVYDPGALLAASFQMSVLCVGLIAGVAVPLLEQTIEPYVRGLKQLDSVAYDRALPPRVAQFRLDLRLMIDRLRSFLPNRIPGFVLVGSFRALFGFAGLITISAVMQLGLALPMAYYFHRATSVAIPANLLLVPLLELLMPAAVLAIGLSYVSFLVAKIPAAVAGLALAGMTQSVHWLGGLRIADVRVPSPGVVVMAVTGLLVVLAVCLARRRGLSSMAAVLLLCLNAATIWRIRPAPTVPPNAVEITAIDVGQGDSLLAIFPDSKKVLIDAGGFSFWMHSRMDIGEDVVSSYLWSRGISQLDAVVLTHAHQDHMGGLPAIIANFHPRELWLPEGIAGEEIPDLLTVAKRQGLRIVEHKAGDVFDYGGAVVRVLAPDPKFPVRVSHRNDESLVMKVTYGNTSALLEADAEKGTERLLETEQPAADLLKVAHHGSASSTNTNLLAAVRPQFALISVGSRNVYGHPRLQVLERLEQFSVATYRTDVNGITTFYLDGTTVTPATALR